MEIKEQIELEIIDLNRDGDGVARFGHAVVFVSQGLPGDKVLAEITEIKKNYIKAKTLEILKGSGDKEKANCKYSSVCSGCSTDGYKYQKELELKKKEIEKSLYKFAKIERKIQVLASEKQYGYRNRISLKIDRQGKIGYHKRSSKELIEIDTCILARDPINTALKIVKKEVEALSKKTLGNCPLEEVLIRISKEEKIQLVFTGPQKFLGKEDFFARLASNDQIISIYHKEVQRNNRRQVSYKYRHIYGEKKLNYQIGKYTFKISAESFTQVNDYMVEKLYEKAKELIDQDHSHTLLDLFSGVGTTTIYFSDSSKNLTGVEIVKEAVKDANLNAKLNAKDNVAFYCLDANEELGHLIEEKSPDTIVVDPPRAGLKPILKEQIASSKTQKLIYISCDPVTLARDIKDLTDKGFELKEIMGVDMFPRTLHVETICLMSRIKD